MPDNRIIDVQHLRKAYGERVAVDDLDLHVDAGEIVGLIGANGAGKTTTVECIEGLVRPDGGRLRVLGLDPARDGRRLRAQIGCQLQDASLPDRLRVGEAVELFGGGAATGAAGTGVGADGAGTAADLLATFGLDHLTASPFAGLSGGERQRLFLVLALLHRPRLVVLDELTQGLDPSARRTVWASIDELRRDGVTVLLVTHELDEAEALCDRVVALRAGRVLDEGTPAELVDRHGRQATTRFTLAAAAVERLGLDACPGVTSVEVAGGRVTVRGDRTSIAHVGARLVGAKAVPADLAVTVPSLEDALVDLLRHDVETGPTTDPSTTSTTGPSTGPTTDLTTASIRGAA